MPAKKTKKKESDEKTLRDVEREMAKPRIPESVRKAAVKADTDESSNGEKRSYEVGGSRTISKQR